MGKGAGKIIAGALVGVAIAGFTMGGAGVLMFGISMVASGIQMALNKPPKISQRGYETNTNDSNQIAGLPIPFGKTGVQAGLNQLGFGPEGQPVFGVTVVARATVEHNRYLWLLCAVCHGPIKSVDTIYLNGKPALTRQQDLNGVWHMRAVKAGPDYLLSTSDWQDGDFRDVAAAIVAHGTDGQWMPPPMSGRTGFPLTVVGSARVNADTRVITVASPHPWDMGDCITLTDVQGVANNTSGYNVVKRVSSTVFWIRDPAGAGGPGGAGGTADYWHTPPYATFGENANPNAMGEGVCYILLRCTYDDMRFPSGVPTVTVGCSGISGVDPRTARTLTISQTTDGGALGTWYDPDHIPHTATAYGHVAQITFSAAHLLSEGDIIQISGTNSRADGMQRVDRVVNSTTILVCSTAPGWQFTPFSTTVGGTAVTCDPISNPIIALRTYLLNNKYGCGVSTSEIDDTAFIAAANYCDANVYVPDPDTAIFDNTRDITGSTAGSPTVIDVDSTDGLTTGDTVYIQGALVPALNVRTTITVLNSTQVSVPISTASSGGAGGTLQRQIQQPRFQIAGILDSSATLKDNLEKLCLSCRCTLVYQAGIYYPSIRQPVATVMDITQDHIIGNWSFRLPGQEEMVNLLRGTFINPARGYQLDQTMWPQDPSTNGFLTQDQNQLNLRDVELPLIDNVSRANQILMVLRRESRVARTASFTAFESVMKCAVGDLVTITHETPGWVQIPHWITAMMPLQDGTVQVVVEGYDPSSYDLDATDDVPFAAVTNLPTAFNRAEAAMMEVAWRRGGGGSGIAGALDKGYLHVKPADPRLAIQKIEYRTRVGAAGAWSNYSSITAEPYEMNVNIPADDWSSIQYRAYVMGTSGVLTGLQVNEKQYDFIFARNSALRITLDKLEYDYTAKQWTMWIKTFGIAFTTEVEFTVPINSDRVYFNDFSVIDISTGERGDASMQFTYDAVNGGYPITWPSRIDQTWEVRVRLDLYTGFGGSFVDTCELVLWTETDY